MYQVTILGCESSHAKHFLSLLAAGLYSDTDIRVPSVFVSGQEKTLGGNAHE